MAEPFIAEIKLFAGNFAPRGYAFCNGQLLSIAQNSALFSLVGTIYGGDGETTFGLPDLRGRMPMHWGNGPGLTSRPIGQKSGTETNALAVNQLPAHNHSAGVKCVEGPGNSNVARNNVWSKDLGSQSGTYHSGPADANMLAGAVEIGATGGGQPVNNLPPYQCVSFIIALVGLFPSEG